MLPGRVKRGVLWWGLSGWSGALVSLAGFVITARILGPEPYGIVAFALVFIAIPHLFVGKSIVDTLVQRETLTEDHTTSTLWFATSAALVFLTTAALIAPLAGETFGQTILAYVLPAYAVVLLPEALKSVPAALLQRDLRFGDVAAADAVAFAASAAACLVCAVAGFGVWSLVIGALTQSSVSLVLVWRAARWRPAGRFRFAALFDLANFNLHVFAADFFHLASNQVQRVIIGTVLGVEALGVFVFSWNLVERLKQLIQGPIDAVALPSVAKMREDVIAFRPALLQAMRLNASMSVPVFLGAATVAPVAIPVVFGDRWLAAGAVVQVIMLIGVRAAVTSMHGATMQGFGRADLQTIISAVSFALAVLVVWIAAPYGVVPVAAAVVGGAFATWPLSVWFVKRVSGVRVLDQIMAGAPAFAAGIGMAAAVISTEMIVPPAVSGLVRLAALIVVGTATYPLLFLAFSASDRRRAYVRFAGCIARGDFQAVKRLFS